MKIEGNLTDGAILLEIGRRLERTRLEKNLTQADVAEMAGVSRATLQRLETGQGVAATSLIRAFRALGLLDALERTVPELPLSPMEQLKLQGRRRQRAARATATHRPGVAWRWGDQAKAPER